MMKVKANTVTVMIVPNGLVSVEYVESLGLIESCSDRRETHYTSNRLLTKREQNKLAGEIGRQVVSFYEEEVA